MTKEELHEELKRILNRNSHMTVTDTPNNGKVVIVDELYYEGAYILGNETIRTRDFCDCKKCNKRLVIEDVECCLYKNYCNCLSENKWGYI